MKAKIKPLAIVRCNGAIIDWGVPEDVPTNKHLTKSQRYVIAQKNRDIVFTVKQYSHNRRCIVIADGFGEPDKFGFGPITVIHSDLIIMEE